MSLPNLNAIVQSTVKSDPTDGPIQYQYRPFYNLHNKQPLTGQFPLNPLRLKASEAKIDINSDVSMFVEESYDGSANIIINDGKNSPKLINSRFYLTDSMQYKIGDRKGNVDTNIYSKENFISETNLIKTVNSLVKVDFDGLTNGGKMPIGNYTFYFKLADSDGNESDFIAESGRIVCHIGNINKPQHIRGGQLNEDSGKIINLVLKDLDLAYTYINVYYTRSTGTEIEQVVTAHKITNNFKIKGIETPINITGYETHEEISLVEINTQYTNFDAVKSITNCQNISFAGNVTKNYDLYRQLENLSLYITPELVNTQTIGELNKDYTEKFNQSEGYEYYNTKNIYYKLGYWDEEIYRFGIVYILNDYTISPVFNIRGIKELSANTKWNDDKLTANNITADFVIQDDYVIEGTAGLENSKGIFRINFNDENNPIFRNTGIFPLGIRFNFNSNVINSLGGLGELTKGFFIVRQPRIPTILAQSVGISTTNNGNLPVIKNGSDYIIESFLSKDLKSSKNKPYLGRSLYHLKEKNVSNNALLCPEADLRTELFNVYFNSSTYAIKEWKYQPNTNSFNRVSQSDQYYLETPKMFKEADTIKHFPVDASLLLIEPHISLIKNKEKKFSSLAGLSEIAHNAVDVEYGDYNDPLVTINPEEYSNSAAKVRGIFNTYLGTNIDNIKQATYYNIYQQGYDFDANWKNYFKIRYNDSTAYFPVSDRYKWNELYNTEQEKVKRTKEFYRGDCYINTFTHRMNWNFTDPELPINDKIIDKYTWFKHWKVVNKASVTVDTEGKETETLSYNKLLPIFTYKKNVVKAFLNEDTANELEPGDGIVEPEDKKFKKYSESNGLFGADKLNRPDINAVDLGHWVTFKVCSNVNLAMRDTDPNRASEEATFGMKRSFYPLQEMDRKNKLAESRILNNGISKTGGDKYYYDLGDIPFIKDSFTTRIYYSNVLQQSTFVNGNRVFLTKNYQDYSMEHGEIIKLVEWYGTLIAIMEHGILMIPVNERAMMTNESGENVYINTENTLPKNPRVISDTFGSLWETSIIKTARFIYGIDTVGKKIWRTNGETLEILSDMVIQQFLNENINLKATDKDSPDRKISVKTHYNAFKQDIHFVFRYGTKKWHLCYNEALSKWVTRYSWFPAFSENINNIFYTFADTIEHKNAKGILYKHGFAGTKEEKGLIKPTFWYDEQHPFEFEFVVNDTQGIQKIFNNLKIISNRVEPNSLLYELTGDGYEWRDFKKDIIEINGIDPEADYDLLAGFGSPFKKIF